MTRSVSLACGWTRLPSSGSLTRPAADADSFPATLLAKQFSVRRLRFVELLARAAIGRPSAAPTTALGATRSTPAAVLTAAGYTSP